MAMCAGTFNTSSASTAFLMHCTPRSCVYTLSLHDALPIFAYHAWSGGPGYRADGYRPLYIETIDVGANGPTSIRSEEHTSELQSHHDLVCRLLLEKKNTITRLVARPVYVLFDVQTYNKRLA